MNVDKKQLIIRNPDYYSELEFARRLKLKGQESYFPFKDRGIDIVGINKKGCPFFYQLKARNINRQYNSYWFPVKLKKLIEFPRGKNCYWVFCAFKDKGKIDFFQVPISIVLKWYNETIRTKKNKDEDHLQIDYKKGTYRIAPERVAKKINIMKYLLKLS